MRVKTSSRPWFLLAAALLVTGVLTLHGMARSITVTVAALTALFACIRYIALAVRGDDVRSSVLRVDGLHGWSAAETGDIRRSGKRRER